MRTHRIAAIPADGIGKEVIPAGLRVLQALAERSGDFRLDVTDFPWGTDYYRETGKMMAEDGLETLKGFDAIFFGAVGDQHVPDDITLWGLRLKICQGFDQYANIRPTRVLPGLTSPLRSVQPGDIDWVIVRENSRRRICRPWRPRPSRPPGGGRHRDGDLHPCRRHPDHAHRLRHRRRPAAQEADRRHQVQRAEARHGLLGRGRRRGRRANSRP